MQYSNKEILKITFPVMMSLLMEHLIGLTDTAYLGRVGEVELGASALAGVYYLVIFMLGFAGPDCPAKWRKELCQNRRSFHTRHSVLVDFSCAFIYDISSVFSFVA